MYIVFIVPIFDMNKCLQVCKVDWGCARAGTGTGTGTYIYIMLPMHVVTIGNASTTCTCRISWIGDSESQIGDFPSHEPALYDGDKVVTTVRLSRTV